MDKLIKIRDISNRYDITARTLRYYEDIGLLTSIRSDEVSYRMYDEDAIRRIEQILILRKLNISIKDIKRIFDTTGSEVVLDVLKKKIESIDDEISLLYQLKEIVFDFIQEIETLNFTVESDIKQLYDKAKEIEMQITNVDYIGKPSNVSRLIEVTNKLDKKGFNTENIEKIDANKDIIYPITMVKNEASYEMDLNIPVFNITGDAPAEFNNTTQQSFINKANQIMTGENTNSQNSGDVKPNTNQNTNNVTNNESSNSTTNETNTITIDTTANTRVLYDVSYQAYINGDILSVIIKSSLKEGNNPQRVMVQTYNYNLATKQSIELTDIIQPYGLTEDEINSKIKQVTEEAVSQEDALSSAGYETYKRDLASPIYQIENIHTFFLGSNGDLYIIFAYGNNNYTSEMDIIKMQTYPDIGE
jgi:DNA-binding transcriptional MerR regulator